MGRRKGFIHIVEVIIIVIVMFVVLWQFTYVPKAKTEWSRAKLTLKGNDILFSLDRKGIDWFDPEEIKSEFNRVLGQTNILYDLTLRNVIKPDITVGCICNDTEFLTTTGILESFWINGVYINFTPEQIDPSDQPERYLSEFYDVIILWDYNLTGYEQVSNYLEADRGIVEVRDLDPEEINNFEVQKTLFGLEYNSSLPTGAQNIAFSGLASHPNSTYHNIFKHFYHTPNSTGGLIGEPYTFPDFLGPNERVSPRGGDERRIILRQGVSNASALVVNQGMGEGFGRTAWLSGGPLTEEMKVLIRDLVTWAAGDTYRAVPNDVITPVTFSIYKLFKPAGLVAQWNLDEGSGTIARDTSGNANHGDITGGPGWAEGRVDKALELDGLDDYVDIDDSVSLHSINRGFTIEGWFNTTDLSLTYNPVISKYVFSDPLGNRVYVTDTGRLASRWFFTDGSSCDVNSSIGAINENQWYHFAYAYNKSHIMLYLNGNPVTTVNCGAGKVLDSIGGDMRIGGM